MTDQVIYFLRLLKMQTDATSDTHETEGIANRVVALGVERPPVRGYLRATVIVVLVWLAIGYVLSGQYVDWQTRRLLADAEEKIEQDIADIATGLERNLAIFHGIPAIVSRDDLVRRALLTRVPVTDTPQQTPAERRTDWLRIPELAKLNASLARSANDVRALSVIWVINPTGDCIAASNSETRESFVGVNYSDREYFKAAQKGKRADNSP